MADKRTQRAQKKRAKQKRKREQAADARARRTPKAPRAGKTRVRLHDAVDWPVGEAYLSGSWHEHGARVHGAFTREHADGRIAAAFFHADLRQGGITEVVTHGTLERALVHGELARRSDGTDDPMLVVDPHLVAKVLHTARELDAETPDPPGLDEVIAFLGPIDGSGTDFEVLTGPPPPPAEKRKSLFGWLFG